MSRTYKLTLVGLSLLALFFIKCLVDYKLRHACHMYVAAEESEMQNMPIMWSYTPYPNVQINHLGCFKHIQESALDKPICLVSQKDKCIHRTWKFAWFSQ